MASQNKQQYKFTRHAIDRFKERFGSKVQDDNPVRSLAIEIYKAKIDNSIKNDTKFITNLHENHGYDSFQFLVSDDIVFVCRNENLVTLYDRKDSRFNNPTSRFKK